MLATPPRDEFEVSADSSKMDVAVVHAFLTQSYWAGGIDEATVRRSIENSLCFGAFRDDQQVGFARVVTDRATFAYLADVFVVEAFRGRGLSRRLVQAILDHPELQGLRRWMLATRDAHGLYEKLGFTLSASGRLMERLDPDVYRRRL